eukprot:gnl/MRDRNA2_/MRDRNA2_55760_c0_seq1.p1 gnl/MRDRNA2_/MRDRNA2_55760_c0~~gnl/MRDRNA2_/MRDRNA2_55760_c0_seq1.p1  ORF type:complete len:214 (+),score=49.55 gnl/MRDRNA2_/MRDRNA2_55760_c0_seq1:107-748(+)
MTAVHRMCKITFICLGLGACITLAWKQGLLSTGEASSGSMINMAGVIGRPVLTQQAASSSACSRGFLQKVNAKTKCIHPGKKPKCGDCPDLKKYKLQQMAAVGGAAATMEANAAATADMYAALADITGDDAAAEAWAKIGVAESNAASDDTKLAYSLVPPAVDEPQLSSLDDPSASYFIPALLGLALSLVALVAVRKSRATTEMQEQYISLVA